MCRIKLGTRLLATGAACDSRLFLDLCLGRDVALLTQTLSHTIGVLWNPLPRGSIYTAIMKLGPEVHPYTGSLGT